MKDHVILHAAAFIAKHLQYLAFHSRCNAHFAAHCQRDFAAHFFTALELAGYPGIVDADQFFLAKTDDLVLLDEVDGVDQLVLQKGADVGDETGGAATDQQRAGGHARISAVIAHIANDADFVAEFVFRQHLSCSP